MAHNYFSVQGNLTRDPELRFIPSGTAVVSFGLAHSKRFKKGDEYQEKTSFFDVEAWGKLAELLNDKLKKGDPVLISGEMEQDTWEKDGQKRSKFKFTVRDFEKLARFTKQDSAESNESSSEPETVSVAGDDEIPF